mmetsp:Transcript_54096/g.114910  ORF Transcript_54096/g.114910 Transcript_54096/m.114910 type:complete len:116 (+) Transcript_54096:627-974(+)
MDGIIKKNGDDRVDVHDKDQVGDKGRVGGVDDEEYLNMAEGKEVNHTEVKCQVPGVSISVPEGRRVATAFTGSVCGWAPRTCTRFAGGQSSTTRSSDRVVRNGVKQKERKARTSP